MDFTRRFLKNLWMRLRLAVSRRVHDRRIQTRLQVGSALALGIGLLLSTTLLSGILDPYQSRFSDFFYHPAERSDRVVVIGVDNESLSEFSSLPIPAPIFATALRNIAAARPELIASEPVYEPSPEIAQLAPGMRSIPHLPQPDADGVFRRAPVLFDDVTYVGQRDPEGRIYLNFVDPARRLFVSFADVYHGRFSPSLLRGRIVLLGVTSPAASETVQTPLSYGSRKTFPIEVQADLAETLANDDALVQQDRLTEVTMIFLMALLAGATLPHIRLLSSAGLTIVYLLAYVGYGFAKFNEGVIVQPLYPALALVLTAVAIMTYRHFAEDRPTELVRQLFQRHIAPEGLDALLRALDHGTLALAGARREISVLCVDLSAFTALAGTMSPQSVLRLFDRYTEVTISTIFQHGGSLVSRSGDAIIATWNVPLEQSAYALQAARAALEVKHKLAQVAAESPHKLDLDVGMGIATGPVVAGRVGKRDFREYAVFGEPVEIAGRLALNSDHTILMDVRTLEAVGDAIQTSEAKPMRVRGKAELVATWQICEPVETTPAPYPTASSAGPEHSMP